MIVKHVDMVHPDEPPFPLATFYLDGDSVIAHYHSDDYRMGIERQGIIGRADGKLRELYPSDGKVFFDALEKAYANSSFVDVRVADEPDPRDSSAG